VRAPAGLVLEDVGHAAEVVRRIPRRLSDKGITERFVSLNTVGTHVRRIFRKLDLPRSAWATVACSPSSSPCRTRFCSEVRTPHSSVATRGRASGRDATYRSVGGRRRLLIRT
jgi:hypothetical protein